MCGQITCPFTRFKCSGCTFVTGDQTGGTHKRLGTTDTESECAYLVRQKEPGANGASFSLAYRTCYANYGSTGTNDNQRLRTCIFAGQYGMPKIDYYYVPNHNSLMILSLSVFYFY